MTITFQNLADKLAPGAIEFVGNNQLKVNFSQLTGDTLTFDSSCIKAIVKLMEGLSELTNEINSQRANQNPPLLPIDFVSQQIVGSPQEPKYQFVLQIAVDTASFSNNLVDPTAS